MEHSHLQTCAKEIMRLAENDGLSKNQLVAIAELAMRPEIFEPEPTAKPKETDEEEQRLIQEMIDYAENMDSRDETDAYANYDDVATFPVEDNNQKS